MYVRAEFVVESKLFTDRLVTLCVDQCEIIDRMGLDQDSVMIIHGGVRHAFTASPCIIED